MSAGRELIVNGLMVIRAAGQRPETVHTDRSPAYATQTSVDDLKLIIGIGSTMAEKLTQMGIVRLEQIADWNPSEIDALERQLGAQGRIEQERWVEQARQLVQSTHRHS